MNNKDLEVPQSDAADIVHTSVTVALSLIPFVGAGELFKATITPSLEKRKDAWMQKVAEAIEELQNRKGVNLEELKGNEEFVTILIDASKIAVGTHLEEKRKMLKNILVNSFAPESTFDVASHYLRLVDQLTEVHMRILRHMQTESIVHPALSQTKLKDKFYSELGPLFRREDEIIPYVELPERIAFVNDLERMGLIVAQYIDPEQTMSVQKPYFTLTMFAKKFLDFIERPVK